MIYYFNNCICIYSDNFHILGYRSVATYKHVYICTSIYIYICMYTTYVRFVWGGRNHVQWPRRIELFAGNPILLGTPWTILQ